MNKAQIILLIVLVLGFVVLGIILSQTSGSGSTFKADRPFLARAGTSRGNARAITSEKAPDIDPPPAHAPLQEAPTTPDTLQTAAPQETPSPSPYDTLLAASSPEQGLALAQELLTSGEANVSELHRAIGTLYGRLEPANLPAALDALAVAKDAASTPEQALLADLEAVRLLRQNGQTDQAIQRAEEVLANTPADSAARLHIALARADALAEKRSESAEAAYRETMQHALAAEGSLGTTALDVYRLAGLRLARLYRLQERHGDAQAVGEEVRKEAALHAE